MQQLKFIFGSILAAPLMPVVFFQGNKIRREFPRLPEAEGPEGKSGEAYDQSMQVVGAESTMACVGIDTHANGFIGQFSNELAERLAGRSIGKYMQKVGTPLKWRPKSFFTSDRRNKG